MSFNPPNVPFFYINEERFQAILGSKGKYEHYYGKSPNEELKIINTETPEYIHQLITLDLNDPYIGLSTLQIKKLPILYPFLLDGGDIKYKIKDDHTVSVVELNGTYTGDWPYVNYPKHFKYLPFELTKPVKSSKNNFDGDVMQGIRYENEWKCLIAIIPDTDVLPDFLWEIGEHEEDIHVKCFFDYKNNIVSVYNECD